MVEALLLRWPNIGHPCLARKDLDTPDLTFRVIFGGSTNNLNVKSLLKGKLFLQRLADTKQVLQTKATVKTFSNRSDCIKYMLSIWDMDKWPNHIKDNLIPVTVDKVEAAITSPWKGYMFTGDCNESGGKIIRTQTGGYDFITWPSVPLEKYINCDYAYWVTLRIESKYLSDIRIPQLFNFIQKCPIDKMYNINFHSVYIHEKDWHNFSFIHATDTHIAWRNDFIQSKIQQDWPDAIIKKKVGGKITTVYPTGDYINFNQNFRDFLQYANNLHRQGRVDFIVLTGDLVDFIGGDVEGSLAGGGDNFELFRDLVTAWPICEGMIVDEELEVPLFAITGNHDYRPYEYPLVAQYELSFLGIDLYKSENYTCFGLDEDEARVYETGPKKEVPEYTQDDGFKHISYLKQRNHKYRALINPDENYVIDLGKHRIICLDSRHDEGTITGIWDYLVHHSESRTDFIAGSPDSAGFWPEQIQFLRKQVKDVKGLVIIAFHAPMINIRGNTPHYTLTEHIHSHLDRHDKDNLLLYLIDNDLMAVNFYCCSFIARVIEVKSWPSSLKDEKGLLEVEIIRGFYMNDGPGMKRYIGMKIKHIEGDYHWDPKYPPKKGDYIGLTYNKPFTWMIVYRPGWKIPEGWIIDVPSGYPKSKNTEYFKTGHRDPYLGRGVTDHGFDEFLKVITKEIGGDKIADLILTGHTHRNIEYKIRLVNSEIMYFHDYYIDSTLHGEDPKQKWGKNISSNPLNKTKNSKEWWQQYKPLFVQTLSLGPKPSEQTEGGALLITVQNEVICSMKRVYLSDMKKEIKETAPIQAYFILSTSPP
jgi:hypothetical protein